MQLPQLGTDVGAELLGQPLPQQLVRRERVGLAVAPVERGDVQTGQLLGERVLGHGRGEQADDLTVAAGRQLGLAPGHEQPQALLAEPGALRCDARAGDADEGVTAPDVLRRREQVQPLPRRAGLAGRCHQALALVEVALEPGRVDDVARIAGLDGVADLAAQAGDERLDPGAGCGGQATAPQVVHEALGRDGHARGEGEDHEQVQLQRGQRDLVAGGGDHDRAEQVDAQRPPVRAPDRRRRTGGDGMRTHCFSRVSGPSPRRVAPGCPHPVVATPSGQGPSRKACGNIPSGQPVGAVRPGRTTLWPRNSATTVSSAGRRTVTS